MENLKLISVRLEPAILLKIDELAKRYNYLKRSRIINCLLAAMLDCTTFEDLWKVLSCYDPCSDGVVISVGKRK